MKGLPKIHNANSPHQTYHQLEKCANAYSSQTTVQITLTVRPTSEGFQCKKLYICDEGPNRNFLGQNLRLTSSDLETMYINVPTDESINTINLMCSQQNLDDNFTKELILMTDAIMKQIYFDFQNKFCVQNNGHAMGAPHLSSFLKYI